ncbi:hypothetical protein PENTCL1PPCAC_25792, partial [Pristionchus entomophagus]
LHSLPFGRICPLWPLLLLHSEPGKSRTRVEQFVLAKQLSVHMILRCAVESRRHTLTYDDSRTNAIQNPL